MVDLDWTGQEDTIYRLFSFFYLSTYIYIYMCRLSGFSFLILFCNCELELKPRFMVHLIISLLRFATRYYILFEFSLRVMKKGWII